MNPNQANQADAKKRRGLFATLGQGIQIMRVKIFGAIGIVWGGLIVASWLLADAPASGSAAYQSGQYDTIIPGSVMLLVGLYYFFKEPT